MNLLANNVNFKMAMSEFLFLLTPLQYMNRCAVINVNAVWVNGSFVFIYLHIGKSLSDNVVIIIISIVLWDNY